MNGGALILLFIELKKNAVDLPDLKFWQEKTRALAETFEGAGTLMTGAVYLWTERVPDGSLLYQVRQKAEGNLGPETVLTLLYTDCLIPESGQAGLLTMGLRQYEHNRIEPGSDVLIRIGTTYEWQELGKADIIQRMTVMNEYLAKHSFDRARMYFSITYDMYRFSGKKLYSRHLFMAGVVLLVISHAPLSPGAEDQLVKEMQETTVGETWYKLISTMIERICSEGEETAGRFDTFEQKVHRLIDPEIVNSKLDLKTASDLFGLTPTYFSQVFKQKMGTGFLSYIEKMRMDLGYSLLLQKDLTIEQIARSCGYESVSTFRRNFKKHYGTNPGMLKY